MSPAFTIVGVNGGTAAKTNPCLGSQLAWASANSVGGTSQPRVQLYVNTGNPGEVISQVTTWPAAGDSVTPYGTCDGTNTLSCSWLYGYNRAVDDVLRLQAAAPAGMSTSAASYMWWLDVETMNTWQSVGSGAQARNAATLEGMTAYFQSLGARVGIYSTSYQWGVIVGTNLGITGNLRGLDSWLAGASGVDGAKSFCTKASLTPGGRVVLTQFVANSLDYDYACYA